MGEATDRFDDDTILDSEEAVEAGGLQVISFEDPDEAIDQGYLDQTPDGPMLVNGYRWLNEPHEIVGLTDGYDWVNGDDPDDLRVMPLDTVEIAYSTATSLPSRNKGKQSINSMASSFKKMETSSSERAALRERLKKGEEIPPSTVTEGFLFYLLLRLRKDPFCRMHHLNKPELVWDGFTALVDFYLKNFDRYEPERAPLLSFFNFYFRAAAGHVYWSSSDSGGSPTPHGALTNVRPTSQPERLIFYHIKETQDALAATLAANPDATEIPIQYRRLGWITEESGRRVQAKEEEPITVVLSRHIVERALDKAIHSRGGVNARISLDQPLPGMEEEDNSAMAESLIPSSHNLPMTEVNISFFIRLNQLMGDFVAARGISKEITIFEKRLSPQLLGQPVLTLRELKEHTGVSRERVRQLEVRIKTLFRDHAAKVLTADEFALLEDPYSPLFLSPEDLHIEDVLSLTGSLMKGSHAEVPAPIPATVKESELDIRRRQVEIYTLKDLEHKAGDAGSNLTKNWAMFGKPLRRLQEGDHPHYEALAREHPDDFILAFEGRRGIQVCAINPRLLNLKEVEILHPAMRIPIADWQVAYALQMFKVFGQRFLNESHARVLAPFLRGNPFSLTHSTPIFSHQLYESALTAPERHDITARPSLDDHSHFVHAQLHALMGSLRVFSRNYERSDSHYHLLPRASAFIVGESEHEEVADMAMRLAYERLMGERPQADPSMDDFMFPRNLTMLGQSIAYPDGAELEPESHIFTGDESLGAGLRENVTIPNEAMAEAIRWRLLQDGQGGIIPGKNSRWLAPDDSSGFSVTRAVPGYEWAPSSEDDDDDRFAVVRTA